MSTISPIYDGPESKTADNSAHHAEKSASPTTAAQSARTPPRHICPSHLTGLMPALLREHPLRIAL